MPKGGARPGAGRPKGKKEPQTLAKEAAREAVRLMVTAALAPLVEAQIANATGLKYLVTRERKTGKFVRVGQAMAKASTEETIEVWEKEPSVQAFTDLLNRALDKPAEQRLEVHITTEAEIESRLVGARKREPTPCLLPPKTSK